MSPFVTQFGRILIPSGVILFAYGVAAKAQTLDPAMPSREYVRLNERVIATNPPRTFTDPAFYTSTYAPYLDASNLMFATGVTAGTSGNPMLYAPDTPLLREQLAVFLVKAWSIKHFGDPEAFKTNQYKPVPLESGKAHFNVED